MEDAYQVLTATGPETVDGAYSLARSVGAKGLIVQINVFTDTPESAGKFAAHVKERGIKVLVWQLGTEPTKVPEFFPNATDYAEKMRPFADAIKAADPGAKVSLSMGIVRAPFRSEADWDNALAAYRPRYWDVLTYHQYPAIRGTDSELIAILNQVLYSHTADHVSDYIVPRFGAMPLIITESDPGSPLAGRSGETGSAGIAVQPGTGMSGTLYGGIWSAEYALRMSSVPQMKHVGVHQLISPAGVDMARPHHEEILEAFRTKRTVDTRSIDYGFFTSAQGAAYAMAAGAINSASWLYRTAVGGGGTAPLPGGKNMPAVYAQAYDQGRGFSLVVTNKGENAEALSVAVDDRPVNARFQVLTVTGTSPSARNMLGREDIAAKSSMVSGLIPMPAHAVVRISW